MSVPSSTNPATSASQPSGPSSSPIFPTSGDATPTVTNMFTPPVTATLTPSPSTPPGGGNGNGNQQTISNNGSSIATSASLYLYTFLATLVLLLSVSAAIVIRSFILRRRHRRMVEEAIRNGTWVPPTPPSRPVRVDLTKKPVLWEAYIDGKGNVSAMGTQGQWYTPGGAAFAGGGKAISQDWRTEYSTEWDTIKPFSAAYVISGADAVAEAGSRSTLALPMMTTTPMTPAARLASAPSTTSINRSGDVVDPPATTGPTPVPAPASTIGQQPPNANANREPRHRAFLSSAMRILNPTPAPTSPLPASAMAGSGDSDGNRTALAMAELNIRASRTPTAMQIAVLVAMPAAPTHNLAASSSSSGSTPPNSGTLAHPLQQNSCRYHEDEEQPVPHLEVGVAEVLVVPNELSSYEGGYTSGKSGKRGIRGSVGSRESRESDVSEV